MPKKYKTRIQPLETNSAGNTREPGKKNQEQENEYVPLLVNPVRKGKAFPPEADQPLAKNTAPSKNKKAGLYSSLPQEAGLSNPVRNKFLSGANGASIKNPLWISVSEAAKLGGVQTKTIRRAIKSNHIRYKIIGNRYSVDFSSLIYFLHTKTKLKNKLNQLGLGQYIKEWEK